MNKKLVARIKSAIIAGFTAVALTTSAYGAEAYDDFTQISDITDPNGACMYDPKTGEETYLPPPDINTYSSGTEGNVPSYDPLQNEENPEDLPQPLMDNNRDIVDDPASSFESRCTVYITTYDQDGHEVGHASGFLIRSNVVVTAGHVVYNRSDRGNFWVNSAVVTPAYYPFKGSKPYGSATATVDNFYCGQGWKLFGDHDYDWGVIILDTNIGDSTGWFGLHSQSESYNGTSVRANGYDKYYQYTVSGTITSTKSKKLISDNIYVDEGMSGGPCYIYSTEYGYMAVGIISYYTSPDPEGVYHDDTIFRRIDETLYNTLLELCDKNAL